MVRLAEDFSKLFRRQCLHICAFSHMFLSYITLYHVSIKDRGKNTSIHAPKNDLWVWDSSSTGTFATKCNVALRCKRAVALRKSNPHPPEREVSSSRWRKKIAPIPSTQCFFVVWTKTAFPYPHQREVSLSRWPRTTFLYPLSAKLFCRVVNE